MYSNSFEREDYLLAQEAFSNWQRKAYEDVDSYVLRQRKAELNRLVRKVIDKELTPSQKLLVALHWYENLSKKEIALKLGLEPSTVSRRLDRITDIIYEKLKYALEYRYGGSFSQGARLIMKSKDAFFSFTEPADISQRVKKLRASEFFSLEDVSEMTGISVKRLKQIEEGAGEMTATEIKKLSLSFNKSADYFIFGSSPAHRKGGNNDDNSVRTAVPGV